MNGINLNDWRDCFNSRSNLFGRVIADAQSIPRTDVEEEIILVQRVIYGGNIMIVNMTII
jgi:hypothetical protein